jgi:hypothetical protein
MRVISANWLSYITFTYLLFENPSYPVDRLLRPRVPEAQHDVVRVLLMMRANASACSITRSTCLCAVLIRWRLQCSDF